MGTRPSLQVTAPAFGEWLRQLRKGRSLEQLARKLRPALEGTGLKVNPSTLHNFEQGRVPNWPVLFALATVHRVPITEMATRLAASVQFPGAGSDLIRHAVDQTSNPDQTPEGFDDAAATRMGELEARIQRLEIYEAMQTVVRYLHAADADLRHAAESIGQLRSPRVAGRVINRSRSDANGGGT